MSFNKIHLIINQKSAGGSAGRRWHEIESLLKENNIKDYSFQITGKQGDATEFAKKALQEKVETIVVVGGDGTVSEVINGYCAIENSNQIANIVILNMGTGGDFCRTLGVPSDPSLSIRKIHNGKEILVDVGKIRYTALGGTTKERFFNNIAGCGMAGAVVYDVNRSSKKFGAFSYYLGALSNLFGYKNKEIKVKFDDYLEQTMTIVTLAVCNGQFFGGGMQINPEAHITDGLFNITVIEDWNLAEKVLYSSKLYNGTILSCKNVKNYQAKKVIVEPTNPNDRIFIDSDGDDIGMIPLTAEIIPARVKFKI